MSITTRDEQIDMFRGAIMIYIVSVIHNVYWLETIPINSIVSLILFEMPVIFFIAGASFKLSYKPQRNYRDYVNSKIKRLLIPYIIYIAFSFVFFFSIDIILTIFHHTTNFCNLSLRGLLKIILLYDNDVFPYSYHLWFLVPYIFIILSAPFLFKFICQNKYNLFITIIFILCIIFLFDISGVLNYLPIHVQSLTRQILVYTVFFLCGFYYRDLNIKTITLIFFVGLLVFYSSYKSGYYSTDFQTNKFPPNFMFLSFGLVSLLLFSILFSFIKLPRTHLFIHFNKFGFTIYLYQNIVIIFIAVLLDLFNIDFITFNTIERCAIMLCLTALILYINYFASFLFVKIENKIISRIYRK